MPKVRGVSAHTQSCKPGPGTRCSTTPAKIAAACRLIENTGAQSRTIDSVEHLSLSPGVQGDRWTDTERIRGGWSWQARAARRDQRHDEAIYNAGYSSNGRFYETSDRVWVWHLQTIALVALLQTYVRCRQMLFELDPLPRAIAGFAPFFWALIQTLTRNLRQFWANHDWRGRLLRAARLKVGGIWSTSIRAGTTSWYSRHCLPAA